MREKNILRAAEALYRAQADDKNAILASLIDNKEASKLVKDQGRALVILEKIILPRGQNTFEVEEMQELILKKLKKKGHRIQDNETPDDEEYAAEKKQYMDERLAKVPELLGVSLNDLKTPEEELIEKTIAQQEAKQQTYDLLTAQGLPVPHDLEQEITLAGEPVKFAEAPDLSVEPLFSVRILLGVLLVIAVVLFRLKTAT